MGKTHRGTPVTITAGRGLDDLSVSACSLHRDRHRLVVKTVHNHVSDVFAKLYVTDRAAAVVPSQRPAWPNHL